MHHAEVARGTHPSVHVPDMVDVTNPRFPGRQSTSNCRALVGGAVVNEDQFPVRQGLVLNALHRPSMKRS